MAKLEQRVVCAAIRLSCKMRDHVLDFTSGNSEETV